MKHVIPLSWLLASVFLAAVSGSSDEPVKRRDLRYRPNNAYSYQFTSLHSGGNNGQGEAIAAKAFSFQQRFERFGDVKRALAKSIPVAAPPIPLAVIAVDSNKRAAPRFPSRHRGASGSAAANRRRTSVDISSLQQMEKKPIVGVSHSTVVVHH